MYITGAYDENLKFILKNGRRRRNRTGVDTLSVFSLTARYDLTDRFPILTKRKLYPRSVFAELLWMLSGSTDNADLVRLGANFWTPWADPTNSENRQFYERTGFPIGRLGPVYGWQLRHFGGNYQNQTGGVDQISRLVDNIRKDPDSRRHIVSMWNPQDSEVQRLPPCHYSFHVNVEYGNLDLLWNQRSNDWPVGTPSNIQFYAALCLMLAQQTGNKARELIHHAEDCHIYVNQVEAVEEYLSRKERDSPFLRLEKAKDVFSYKVDDFVLTDYNPDSSIKIPVLV